MALVMPREATKHQAQERHGQPVTSHTELAGLKRIRCWNCNRIVATGDLPDLEPGKVLVLQCGHKECRAYNKFEGG